MTPAKPAPCRVLELRQYTLHPGQRDTLIALFEREFIESQEAAGMTLFGQFRDLDAPDRFVWLRGFADMPARADALAAFYGGPVWQAHRDAANVTMLDSDNVLLLRPAHADSGFAIDHTPRAPRDATAPRDGLVVATLHYLDAPVDDAFIAFFDAAIAPVVTAAGAQLLATLVTESAPNTFPRLPVREGEHVFVWFARFDDAAAHARHRQALSDLPAWAALATELQRRIVRTEMLRLQPTARSRLPRAL